MIVFRAPGEFHISAASTRLYQHILGKHHGVCAGQLTEEVSWDGGREVKVYHFLLGGSL